MFHFKGGNLTEISRMPELVTFAPKDTCNFAWWTDGCKYLPHYSSNSWIYISYLDPDDLAKVPRLKVQNNAATQFETIFTTRNESYTGNGMRIVWEDDTHFFLNIGNSNWSTSTNPVLNA